MITKIFGVQSITTNHKKRRNTLLQKQTLTQLRTHKLSGMADALELQWSQPQTYDDICFDERFALIVNQELLKAARFKLFAQKNQIAALQTGDWLIKKRNLLITGPTGCGKTYLACAMGHYACHQGSSVRYYRATRLFEMLTIAHGDGSYLKIINQLAKVDVLILDDWGLEKLTQSQRNDLLEIMEDRHATKSTIVTSQLPTKKWHAYINDATLADAILDRVVHNAHKLELKGESMRKIRSSLTEDEHLG